MHQYIGGTCTNAIVDGGQMTIIDDVITDNIGVESGGQLRMSGNISATNITVRSGGRCYVRISSCSRR